ncbi:MAG: acyl-CoA dehydrogenase [Dehalococcoidia bacterium]|nr:acyl-CoA dehydrogenase [Dehalococcoidia bacterium]
MYFLSEAERMLQTAVRDFARQEIAPIAARIDHTDEFPGELIRKMGELGWMGVLVPREYGGGDGGAMAFVLFVEEIARASASVSVTVSAHSGLTCWPIKTFGTEAQKQRYLPALAQGRMLGAYSLTEPNAGSDAAGIESKAVRDGDDYVLNGRKLFVSNGSVADVVIVFASTDRAARARGISAFLVERGATGFTAGRPLRKLGMHGSPTAELVLEDVRVPVTNRLGEEGQGFRIAMQVLELARILVGAQSTGIAQAALDAALGYAVQREQFGKPIAEFQAVAWMLADMQVGIHASRLMTYEAARLYDAGSPTTMAASSAKLFGSETAMMATGRAIQIHGGYGYIEDFPVERLMRDAKITEIYDGTSEIQRLVIARELLKTVRD